MKDKKELMLDAMGNINPQFIEEYENRRPVLTKSKIIKLSAVAAMLLLAFSLSIMLLPKLLEEKVPHHGNIEGIVTREVRGDYYYTGIFGSGYVSDFSKIEPGSEMAIEWKSTINAMMKSSGIVVKGYLDSVELYQKPHSNGIQYNGFSICYLCVETVYHNGTKNGVEIKQGDRILLYKTVISYGDIGFDNVNKDNEFDSPYQPSGVFYLDIIQDKDKIDVISEEYLSSGYIPDGEIWWGLSSTLEIFEKNR